MSEANSFGTDKAHQGHSELCSLEDSEASMLVFCSPVHTPHVSVYAQPLWVVTQLQPDSPALLACLVLAKESHQVSLVPIPVC